MTIKYSKTKGKYAICSNNECGNTMPLEDDTEKKKDDR